MMTTKELGELSPDDINTTVDGNVFKSPKIISVENGGTLKIGLYKYGYRIIFENGSTSSWIFHADYIALQSGELNPLDSFGFEAKNPENMSTSIEHSNKYINGYIDLSGISNATGVEVIRCYWGDKLTNIPKNSIIESKGKDEIANADGVVFKDYDGDFGDGKFVIETKSSTEVIAESTSVRFAAKDLSANRDVLFAANIKEISNEVLNKSIGRNINSDYSTGIDFRAYRWYENKSSGNMECHLFCTDGGSLPMIDNKKYNYILLTRNKSAENTPYIPRDGSVKISYYYINNSADGFEFDRGINSGPQSG
jgi:hypothetical protein